MKKRSVHAHVWPAVESGQGVVLGEGCGCRSAVLIAALQCAPAPGARGVGTSPDGGVCALTGAANRVIAQQHRGALWACRRRESSFRVEKRATAPRAVLVFFLDFLDLFICLFPSLA